MKPLFKGIGSARMLYHIIRYTLFLAVLIFVGRILLEQLSNIHIDSLSIEWQFLAMALLFEALARYFTGAGYERLLQYFGAPVSFFPAASIAWISFLGKYLPGKFFLVAIAMYYFRQYKIRWEIAGLVPVINTLMTICAALILSSPFVFIFHDQLGLAASFGSAFSLLGCGLFCMKPHLLFSWGRKLIKTLDVPAAHLSLSLSQASVCLGIALLQCLCFGMSTWCIARAFVPVGIETAVWFISVTTFSITLGLFAFFSPAGIGVKEGICFLAFSRMLGPEMASLVAVAARAIYTLMDMISAGVGFLILRYVSPHRE